MGKQPAETYAPETPAATAGTMFEDGPPETTTDPFPSEATAASQKAEDKPEDPEDTKRGAAILAQAISATMEAEVAHSLQRLQAEREKFKMQKGFALLFGQSGLFDDLKNVTAEQAIARAQVKILLGEAAGLTPIESMKSVYLTPGGKPEMDAQIRAARMKRAGYDWRFLQLDEKGCKIELLYNHKPLVNSAGERAIVSFTEDDAKNAKVYNRKKGDWISLFESNPTYRSYPRNMYFSRCITNAQRWYAPEALNGVNFADPTERDEIEEKPQGRPVFQQREASGK